MKKVYRFLTSVLVLLMLAGCTVKDDGSQWRGKEYQRTAFSEEGYYYLAYGSLLCFRDEQNGNNVILCSKVGCNHGYRDANGMNHTEADCEAHLGAMSGIDSFMDFSGDRIYYLVEDQARLVLKSRDATGAAEKTVAIIGEEYLDGDTSLVAVDMIVAGEYAYCTLMIQRAQRNEETGVFEVSLDKNVLCRIHLSSGKQMQLHEEKVNEITLTAAKSDEVVFFIYDRPTLEDPDYEEALRSYPIYIYAWRESTGKTEIVAELTSDQCGTVRSCEEGKLYYVTGEDNETVYKTFDLNDRSVSDYVTIPYIALYINREYMLCKNPEGGYLLYSVKKDQYLPVDVDSGKLAVAATGARGFVLRNIQTQSTGEGMESIIGTMYNYVRYRDLADGLQQKDLVPFYQE